MRPFPSLVLLLAALAHTSCGAGEGEPASHVRPRNLIWISLDTLRADRLGCYGYPRPTTPALDAFARESVLFEDASSPAPWTKPAHASLFTGLWPRRHGVLAFENPIAAEVPVAAQWMSAHGFQTFATVSNSALTLHNMPQGFQAFDYRERAPGPEPSTVTAGAIQQLSGRDPGKPFFAFIHYNDLHARYRSLPPYEAEFVPPYDGRVSGRAKEFLDHVTGVAPFEPRDVAHLSDLYDAALRQLDDQLAELFRYLETSGLLESTLVVVTSDHGEEFFDHGGVNHGMTQFQELVRVPLLFRGPALLAGTRVTTPVSLVDVLPTCLAVLGVPLPPGLDGIDASTLLYSPGARTPARFLYFEASCAPPTADTTIPAPGHRSAIRTGAFKLHRDAETDALAFFDLAADPGEKQDALAAHPEAVQRMLAELDRFEASPAATPSDAGLAAEDLRRLQDLGYVQGGDE